MDLDILDTLNHLYFQPQFSDERAPQVLHCYSIAGIGELSTALGSSLVAVRAEFMQKQR